MTTLTEIAHVRLAIESSSIRWIMKRMPPVSDMREPLPSKEDVVVRKIHAILAVGSVTMTIMASACLFIALPFTRVSIATLVGTVIGYLFGSKTLGSIVSLIIIYTMLSLLLWRLHRSSNGIEDAALHEEVLFRAGAEEWSLTQRLRSNLIFGLVHLYNLFVPLSIAIGLTTAGWYFMSVYLQSYQTNRSRSMALQDVAAVHAAHNKLVFYAYPGVLMVSLIIYVVVGRR